MADIPETSPQPVLAPAPEQAPQAPDNHIPIYDISGKEARLGTIDPSEVTEAVASGKYTLPKGEIPVVNPDGEHGTMDAAEAPDAFKAGYQYATPDMLAEKAKADHYDTAGQTLLAGAEGALNAVTLGTGPALEQATGLTTAEDIRERAHRHGIAHGIGEGIGLVGSAFIPGYGEATMLERAGTEGAAALGLGAEKIAGEAAATALKIGQEAGLTGKALSESVNLAKSKALADAGIGIGGRIGSAATKAAIENMVFEGTTGEVAKMLTGDSDPSAPVQTALIDIGLSGLFGGAVGGALGSVSPLWQATMGKKMDNLLMTTAKKVGGIEGQILPTEIEHAIETSGAEIPAAIKATMSDNPYLQEAGKVLEQTDTNASGMNFQAQKKLANTNLQSAVGEALGKTPSEMETGTFGRSAYEAGNDVKAELVKSVKEQIDPISEQFESVKTRFKDLKIPVDADIPTKIAQLATENGWIKAPSSDEMQMINKVLKDLPLQETLEDLRRFQSTVADEANRKQLWRVGSQLRTVFRDAEDSIVTKALGDQAPELLEKHAGARVAYKNAMSTIDNLNDRLHVGRYSGPDSFIKALKEMSPEDILRRASGKNDVEMLKLLQEQFPAVAQQVRTYHLDEALRAASKLAQPGEILSIKTLNAQLDKLSSELKQFVLPEGAQAKLDAANILQERLAERPHNFSNTARTGWKLIQDLPGSAVAIAVGLAKHNPFTGALAGALTKWLGKDVPDAARLSMLTFLGSNKQIDSGAFKAMFDFTSATLRGENALSKGVSSIFKAGTKVLPEAMMPSANDRKKLDNHLKDLQTNQSALMDVGGKTGHYLPNQGQAIAETSSRVSQYLNSIRPVADKRYPLDSQTKVDPIKKAQYNRALDIAQQPLLVLDAINKGTLTSHDVIAMRTMYPALYARTAQKITNEIIQQTHKGTDIPYNTRMSVSLFMGQPMDSTMTPQAILAAQPVPKQPSQPQTATQPASNPKRSTASLNKLPGLYQTPNQARTARSLRD